MNKKNARTLYDIAHLGREACLALWETTGRDNTVEAVIHGNLAIMRDAAAGIVSEREWNAAESMCDHMDYVLQKITRGDADAMEYADQARWRFAGIQSFTGDFL